MAVPFLMQLEKKNLQLPMKRGNINVKVVRSETKWFKMEEFWGRFLHNKGKRNCLL